MEQSEEPKIAAELPLHLLLCLGDGKKTEVHYEVLREALYDHDLFFHLRRQYFSKRSWFTFRSAGHVALAYFSVNSSNRAEIPEHGRHCEPTPCLCIPPASIVGPDLEYVCSPAPHLPPFPPTEPALLPTRLTSDLLYPHDINKEQTSTFLQLPKRRLGQLTLGAASRTPGWGLYIEEDWHWPTIYFCIVSLVLFSFLFSVVWSAVKDDLQGGFAVAA